MAELTRKCKKCNKLVPARDVRVQSDGSFICFSCSGIAPQESSGSRVDRQPKHKSRFRCLKCKYEFWLSEGHAKHCPYCGGSNVEEKQGEAQKLLDMHVQFRDDSDR